MSGRRQWVADSTVAIKFSGGASVAMSFKGNFFDLTADERQLISELTSIVQIYKDASDGAQRAEQQQDLVEAKKA